MPIISKTANMPTICVLGGTGFVGQHLVYRLADEGYHVRVITRHRSRHRQLCVHPGIQLIEGDIHNLDVLRQHFKGCSAVINLAAILNERRRGDFQKIHVVLPGKIIQACRDRGVRRLLHMSALNADSGNGTSRYLHSKGQGEKLMKVASDDLLITMFRPSVIFGANDHFFNHFATLLKLSPVFFPVVCSQARFAPIYVGDVVQAFINSLNCQESYGKRYDLCGPRTYSMYDLVQFTASTLKIKRKLIGLGSLVSAIQGRVLEHLPGKLFTYDNYLSMKLDNVCSGAIASELGISLSSIESVVPTYLTQQNIRGRYSLFRSKAGRGD